MSDETPPPINGTGETPMDVVDGMIASKPFAFQREYDGSLGLRAAVLQALGAASVCWNPGTGDAVFMPERAIEVADALLEFIRDCTLAELLKQTREQS